MSQTGKVLESLSLVQPWIHQRMNGNLPLRRKDNIAEIVELSNLLSSVVTRVKNTSAVSLSRL